MLNLLQCQGFAPWSANYQFDWVEDGKMKYVCDKAETQDLLLFQQFTSLIPIKQGKGPSGVVEAFPEVTKTGVPLSTIIVAHHNLVTYGVPYETWTNPGPGKRFYSPLEVIPALANSSLFREGGNPEVGRWLATAELEPDVTKGVPGMSEWVLLAKSCLVLPKQTAACTKLLGSHFWEDWHAMHPNAYEDNAIADGAAKTKAQAVRRQRAAGGGDAQAF